MDCSSTPKMNICIQRFRTNCHNITVQPIATLSPHKLWLLVYQTFGPFWPTLPVTFVPIELVVIFHLGLPPHPPPTGVLGSCHRKFVTIDHVYFLSMSFQRELGWRLSSRGIPCLTEAPFQHWRSIGPCFHTQQFYGARGGSPYYIFVYSFGIFFLLYAS
jgi:hypothetical protein